MSDIFLSIILSWLTAAVPELAVEVPKDAWVGKGSWQRNPLRLTRWWRAGYFTWCDDPDCPYCADVVYKYDPLRDNRPVVPIRR